MWTLMTDAELVSAVRGGAVEPQEAVASLLTPSHGTAPPRAARGTEANGFASLRRAAALLGTVLCPPHLVSRESC